MKKVLLAVFITASVHTFLAAQPGKPDQSFGAGGYTTTNFDRFNQTSELLSSVALQPDGKILYAGIINGGGGFVFRFKANAPLPYQLRDSSFGIGGTVYLPNMSVTDIVLQPDGKILLSGYVFNGFEEDFALVRLLSNGARDLSFGVNGQVITRAGTVYSRAEAIALQPDGKVIIAGTAYHGAGASPDFVLARYSANGVLDNSFDSDGLLPVNFGTNNFDVLTDLAIQADGKIIAAGYTSVSIISPNYDMALARLNTDGTPDNGFGTAGKVITAIGAGHDLAMKMALQPDNKIVVAGYNHNGTNEDFALLRFNGNGTPDNSFSGDGKLTTAFGSGDDGIYGVALQGDGKIIAAGYSMGPEDKDMAIARYTTAGVLDASFDGDGKMSIDLDPGAFNIEQDAIGAVAVQPDGKIVLAGRSFNGQNNDLLHARLLPNGAFDAGFSNGTSISGGSVEQATAMAIQPDGKIVLAGRTKNNDLYDPFAFLRYKTNGTPDSSFGTAGKLTVSVGSFPGQINTMVVQPDGKILAGGMRILTGNEDWLLMRRRPDGSADPDFATTGELAISFGSRSDQVTALALQPDGKIVAGGFMTNASNQTDFALMRFNSNGSPDVGFGTGGIVMHSPGNYDKIQALLIQPDGKILAAGFSAGKLALARYNADGSMDPSFGLSGIAILPVNTTFYTSDVTLQPDGKMLVAGNSYVGAATTGMFTLVRLLPNGTPDNSFDQDGIVSFAVGATDNILKGVEVQKDHKIVVAGTAYSGSHGDLVVVRYLPDGRADNEFDGDGKLVIDLAGTHDELAGMQLAGDRIYLGGTSVTEQLGDFMIMVLQNNNHALRDVDSAATVRIWPNPTPDILNIRVPAYGEGTVHLQVTDIAGRIIYRRSLTMGMTPLITTIPVQGLQTGVYTLTIRSKKGREVLLFVKGR